MREFWKYCRLRLPLIPMECIICFIVIKLISGVSELNDILTFIGLIAIGFILYYILRKVLKSDELEKYDN